MFWLHAYGRSMGSLHVLWTQNRTIPYACPKGFRKVHVRTPYGFLWISYGLGNTIMYAGVLRMPKTGFRISVWSVVLGRMGPDEATFMLYWPGETDYGTFVQKSPARPLQEGLQAFYGHKIVGKPYVWKSQHPYGSKHLRNFVRACTAWRVITHGAPNCPGASCALGMKHRMLR